MPSHPDTAPCLRSVHFTSSRVYVRIALAFDQAELSTFPDVRTQGRTDDIAAGP